MRKHARLVAMLAVVVALFIALWWPILVRHFIDGGAMGFLQPKEIIIELPMEVMTAGEASSRGYTRVWAGAPG